MDKFTFTLIISQQGSSGYQEDDWQLIFEINNSEDLYNALKEGYLTDAHNRNNYPICSFPVSHIYTKDDLSEYNHCGSINHRDLRRYNNNIIDDLSEYNYTFNKFNRWKTKVQTLIPRLRENKRKIDIEKRELESLFFLAKKYKYNLVKI